MSCDVETIRIVTGFVRETGALMIELDLLLTVEPVVVVVVVVQYLDYYYY